MFVLVGLRLRVVVRVVLVVAAIAALGAAVLSGLVYDAGGPQVVAQRFTWWVSHGMPSAPWEQPARTDGPAIPPTPNLVGPTATTPATPPAVPVVAPAGTHWAPALCMWALAGLVNDEVWQPPGLDQRQWAAAVDEQATLIRITVCGPNPLPGGADGPWAGSTAIAGDPPQLTPAGCQWALGRLEQFGALHAADTGRLPAWSRQSQQQHDDWDRGWAQFYVNLSGHLTAGCGS